MTMLRAALLGAALSVLPAAAQAQSFNCNYARSPDEVAICQNERLAEFDDTMAQIYFRLRNSLDDGARANLEADQANWLRSRGDCGADLPCIVQAYRRRISELRAY